jgi:hypothetical protein
VSVPCDRICREGDCPCDIPLLSERLRDLAEELEAEAQDWANDAKADAARRIREALS